MGKYVKNFLRDPVREVGLVALRREVRKGEYRDGRGGGAGATMEFCVPVSAPCSPTALVALSAACSVLLSRQRKVPPIANKIVMIISSAPLTRRNARAPWYHETMMTTGTPRISSSVNSRSRPCDQPSELPSISALCSNV